MSEQLNMTKVETEGKVKIGNIELAKYEAVSTKETEDRNGWIKYGEDNQYPMYLIDLAQNTPTHSALVTGIAQYIAGTGIKASNPTAQQLLDRWKFNKQLPTIAYDLYNQGGFYLEAIKTGDLKSIAKLEHLPFEKMRVRSNDRCKIVGGYFSQDWSDTRKKRNSPVPIDLYDPADTMQARGLVYSFVATPGSQYYPKPPYIGGLMYIEISRQVAMYHLNNIQNGLFPSFIIQFNNGQPDEQAARQLERDISRQIQGAQNAGKYLLLFNDSKEQEAKFDPFPISDASDQYQFLSKETDSKILVSHRVTTPLLFGIRTEGSGFGSNKDEMAQGLEIFMNKVINPMREQIIDTLIEVFQQIGIDTEITFEADKTNILQDTQLSEEKKKTCCLSKEWSEEESTELYELLKTKCESIDLEEWELVGEGEVDSTVEDEAGKIKEINSYFVDKFHEFASVDSYANGDEKSEEDSGLYKLRYVYAGEVKANTRPFCRDMVALADDGKVFRFEDIEKMSADGVNGQFAPAGQSSYDLFTWKGGVYCHHFWKRQIYFRKRKNGKFLPNDGLKNDIKVGNVPYVRQKGEEAVKPIDTPTRGSLKNA